MSTRRKDGRDGPGALRVAGERSGEPLRECVASALESYFEALGGHECSGLFRLVMSEVEAPLLQCVLRRTEGNQSRAAEILGINRSTLRKKLREHDIL